jgi:hypothetical protein
VALERASHKHEELDDSELDDGPVHLVPFLVTRVALTYAKLRMAQSGTRHYSFEPIEKTLTT